MPKVNIEKIVSGLKYYRRVVIAACLLLFFIIGIVLFVTRSKTFACEGGETYRQETIVKTGVKNFKAEVLTTPEEREKGLSGRACLPRDGAVVFEHEKDDIHGYWMKDMKFPLDIIWLDKDKKVITIAEALSAETYPKIFTPTSQARYVIEVNARHAEEFGIDVGDQLSW